MAGYVAVSDLTFAGNRIRGVTYSPFMPLIAVAIIYLILVMFLTRMVSKLERGCVRVITVKGLKKSFGQLEVLKGIDQHITPGEKVVIIGPSGSGKSTLLRCLNHLETTDSGEIRIDGQAMVTTGADGAARYRTEKDLRGLCLKMGLVFQDYNLFPHYTVLRNIVAPQQLVLHRSRQEPSRRPCSCWKRSALRIRRTRIPATSPAGSVSASHRPRAGHGSGSMDSASRICSSMASMSMVMPRAYLPSSASKRGISTARSEQPGMRKLLQRKIAHHFVHIDVQRLRVFGHVLHDQSAGGILQQRDALIEAAAHLMGQVAGGTPQLHGERRVADESHQLRRIFIRPESEFRWGLRNPGNLGLDFAVAETLRQNRSQSVVHRFGTGEANCAHASIVSSTQPARVSSCVSPCAGLNSQAVSSHRFASLMARLAISPVSAFTLLSDPAPFACCNASDFASLMLIGPVPRPAAYLPWC